MAKSSFQEWHSTRLKIGFYETKGIQFIEEMVLPDRRRVDLCTRSRKYGIEIKSGVGDLKSGNGLNVNDFEYAYVVIPEKCVNHAIGYLYTTNRFQAGVIGIDEDNHYYLAKCAQANLDSGVGDIFDSLCSASDEIAHLFYEYGKA